MTQAIKRATSLPALGRLHVRTPPERMPSMTAQPPAAPPSVRDTLFGDRPIDDWGAHTGGVWDHFAQARQAIANREPQRAIAALQAVIATPGLESRHYMQAWHCLRQLGVAVPPGREKELFGVVLEVPVEGGLDLLAAYADGSSRYYNYTGAGEVMDAPDDAIRALTERLLEAGRATVSLIGPTGEPRRGPPGPGMIRLNFITPAGLHFGQGPFEAIQADPKGGPVIAAAIALMQALVERGLRARGKA